MRTLLRCNLGMGDALLCNGLVRVLVKRGYRLIMPCWEHNLASVRLMFEDLQESVECRSVDVPDYPHEPDEIAIGCYGPNFDPQRWDESFYRVAGVPFLSKWTEFEIGADVDFQLGDSPSSDVFIHDDVSRGFHIPMEGYRPQKSGTIFDHYTALMDASEIHCINSSFAIMADLIGAPGKKYLHRYARNDGGTLPIFGREWRILDAPL